MYVTPRRREPVCFRRCQAGTGRLEMVGYDFIENENSYVINPTDVMTGDRNRRRQLYYQLIQSIYGAKQIDIIVSFLMESGVKMLLKDLMLMSRK